MMRQQGRDGQGCAGNDFSGLPERDGCRHAAGEAPEQGTGGKVGG